MAAEARKCIEALDGRQQDITMLWYLKEPGWLKNFKAGLELLDWSVNIMEVQERVSARPDFQKEVSMEFKRRGVRAVAPDRVVDCWQKDTTKEMCMAAKWPKPFFPVMLQTRPGPTQTECGAFVMFSSWQDAMLALQIMSRTKRYKGKEKSYPAEMVFENQVGDMHGYDFPCRIILDCDAKPSDFGGKFTLEQLEDSIDGVAVWFTNRLIELGAIKESDKIVVYVKHKLDKEENPGDKKRKAPEPDSLEPWRVVDRVPHHGRGQYSVLGFFDKKKGETEYPTLSKRLVIVNGEMALDKMTTGRVSRSECTPDNPLFLELLRRACYTCPVEDFVTINPKFMVQKQVVEFH